MLAEPPPPIADASSVSSSSSLKFDALSLLTSCWGASRVQCSMHLDAKFSAGGAKCTRALLSRLPAALVDVLCTSNWSVVGNPERMSTLGPCCGCAPN